VRWDPRQYDRYAAERARPFADLLARIAPEREPRTVVDLGCGPGTLTATLAERWPRAAVTGVDSSPEMIARAASLVPSAGGRLAFVEADLRDWTPPGPVDVVVSNAALQWVPGHLDLLPRLVATLAPGGVLALGVPGNFEAPSHRLLHQVREEEPWRDAVGDAVAPHLAGAAGSADAATYLSVLATAGCRVDAWETTYLHVLDGDDPVLEWLRGTGARPTLAALPDGDRPGFERRLAALLREAYPRREHGTVLPFRRVFAVAVRT